MPRERDPKRDQAQKIYKASKGTIPLIEIANQLNVPEGTVRGWKAKDKWDDKPKGKISERSEKSNGTERRKKRNAPNVSERSEREEKEDVTPQTFEYGEPENDELNERQRLFCIYYVKSFNGTMSAIKAGYAKDRAHVTASELVRNSKVAAEIKRLKGKLTTALFVDVMDILNKYAEIAFADINDFVEFGQEEVPLFTKKGTPVLTPEGEQLTMRQSFVAFKNSSDVDGTIISEVKQGKDGVSVKLHDKMKALEKLEQYFDILPDKHKRMVEEEKLKMQREKLKIEREKVKKDDDEEGKTIKVSLPDEFGDEQDE